MTFTSLTERLFTNWQAKLLSFGLAILLYAAFQIISLDSKALTIPLEVRTGGNYVLAENAPSFVRVDIRGNAEDIAVIQDSSIMAYIDISYVKKEGSTLINVNLDLAESLLLLDDLDVSVSPSSIALDFEEKAFAWVPVLPSFIGSVLDGYEIDSWVSSYSDVRISGAKSIVNSTEAIYADMIDLHDRTQSFSVESKLIPVSDKIFIETAETTQISVSIVPQIITLEYENLTPTLASLAREFTLSQDLPTVTLELSGEKNPLSAYVPGNNIVEIDFSEVTEVGEYTLPIRINVPQRFSVDYVSITDINVEVIEAPLDTIPTIDTISLPFEGITERIEVMTEEFQ